MANKKKKRVKSKAAQATAEKRAERAPSAPMPPSGSGDVPHDLPEKIEFEGGGGVMTRMRGGFQSAVGTPGQAKRKTSWLSNLIWFLLIIGMVAFMFGPGGF